MVSKAWLRHKKVWNCPLEEHWTVKLPPAPDDERLWGICVNERCKGWTPINVTTCVYGLCQESYCGVCGRNGGGWGPIECPCDGATKGHNTLAERPRARGKVVVSRADDTELLDTYTLVPFRKHKKSRGRRR